MSQVGRTHIGRMTTPVWQDDEIIKRQLEDMDPVRRAGLERRVDEAMRWLAGRAEFEQRVAEQLARVKDGEP
jgi:hypothetical protein